MDRFREVLEGYQHCCPAPGEIEEKRSELQSYMVSKVSAGLGHEVIPAAGQSSGAITETKSAAQIVSDIIQEAEVALRSF